MLIGIDIRSLLGKYQSGVAEYTTNLLTALFKQDKVNDYVLFCNSAHDFSERLPNWSQGNVRLVVSRWPNKLLNYGGFKMLNWPPVDKLIKNKLDVWFMPHFDFIALPKAKNILTVHDLSFWREPKFFSAKQNLWHYNLNLKKQFTRFDRLVAISENTARDLQELAGVPAAKIELIYSGVDELYRPLSLEDCTAVKIKYKLPERFILSLATIEPRKNLDGLITAYNLFRQKNPGLSVALVLAGGDGWKTKTIYETAVSSPYREDIKFLGYIPKEDKAALYNLASVFAFPSLYEGFGFPPLEAMACGTPVVASAATSLPEIIGRAGLLVDPLDINQLAEALTLLLTNEDLKTDLSAQGLAQVKKFNWDKSATEYLGLFRS